MFHVGDHVRFEACGQEFAGEVVQEVYTDNAGAIQPERYQVRVKMAAGFFVATFEVAAVNLWAARG